MKTIAIRYATLTLLFCQLSALHAGESRDANSRQVQLGADTVYVEKVVESKSGVLVTLEARAPHAFPDRYLRVYRKGQKAVSIPLTSLGLDRPPLLTDVFFGDDESLWVAEHKSHKIFRIGLDGSLKWSKWLQGPGYSPYHVIARQDGGLFVSGCVPLKEYLDLGCSLLHEYASGGKYARSHLETDPAAVAKKLFALETYQMDLDANGRILFVDSAIPKLHRLNPLSGKVETVHLQSLEAKPVRTQDPMKGPAHPEEEALFEGVFALRDKVAVYLRTPGQQSHYLLMVDAKSMTQVRADVPVSGRVVGRTWDRACPLLSG